MTSKLIKLLEVKSLVTLSMTLAMVLMLTGVFNPTREVFALFSTTYGATIAYFFNKKQSGTEE